jgi:hypothetical protein
MNTNFPGPPARWPPSGPQLDLRKVAMSSFGEARNEVKQSWPRRPAAVIIFFTTLRRYRRSLRFVIQGSGVQDFRRV